ncbi:hypothetical protein BDV30DRAFT_212009 [Aspergillus minisclerotigenes]|uniref:C2H2-type domain-containing protein n=1 Tax=Aspergillus minisclerotigenes TaxID=656917 RepID=A0A5N6J1D2_9EURO|nr:hypothetical protein BDV30DRAFT_212009 [Aspergillus minisclerotigenes]
MASIAECARDCRELFHQICQLGVMSSLQDRYATFNIWASDIGVFAKHHHASLDFRLRDLFDERDLVIQYLVLITGHLQQLYLLLSATEEVEPPSTPHEPEAITGDDNEVQQLLLDITDSLNWLRRLSNTIRRAGLLNPSTQAKRFPLTDDDGNDNTAVLQIFFSFLIKRDFPNLSGELCSRVVSGMLLQRRLILYRRSRQRKLELRHVSITPRPLWELPFPKVDQLTIPYGAPSMPVQKLPPSTNLSLYTATTLDGDQFRMAAAAPSRISITKAAPWCAQDRFLLPPAPKVHNPGSDLVCPYCCMLLQENVASDPDQWENHVKGDLTPYICLYDNCDDMSVFYSSEDWVSHMRSQHLMRWRCVSRDHEVKLFDTQIDFENHIRGCHPGKFTREQLKTYAECSAYPLGSIFETCPFCGEESGYLEQHVALHLRNIALRSLPWPDEAEFDVEADTPESSTISSERQSRSTTRHSRRLIPLSYAGSDGGNRGQSSTLEANQPFSPAEDKPFPEFEDIPGNSEIRQFDASIPDYEFSGLETLRNAADAPLRLLTWGFLWEADDMNPAEEIDLIFEAFASAKTDTYINESENPHATNSTRHIIPIKEESSHLERDSQSLMTLTPTSNVHLRSDNTSTPPATGSSRHDKSIPHGVRTPKKLVFSPRIQFIETWNNSEYDRRGEIATCNRLTPLLAQQIKEELNEFKMEMEVHETSKVYTHFL